MKLRRWLRRIALAVLVLLLLARAALPVLLPGLVSSALEPYGLSCEWDRLDLSLFGGDVELAHLDLVPSGRRPGPELHIEYLRAALSVPHLLVGAVVIRRLEVDGLDLLVERGADGALVLPPALQRTLDEAAEAAKLEPEPEPVVEPSPLLPLVLAVPLRIDAARLQQVQLSYTDKSISPPLVTRLDLEVRVSDLGAEERDTRLALSASARGILDRMRVEVTGRLDKGELTAGLDLRVGGLRLAPLSGLLAPLGIEPLGPALALDMVGRLTAHDGQTPDLSLVIDTLRATAGTERLVQVGLVSVSASLEAEDRLVLQDVEVAGLAAGLTREADGSLLLPGLRLRPVASVQEPPPPDDGPALALALAIDRLRLVKHSLSLLDFSTQPPSLFTVDGLDLTVQNFDLGPAAGTRTTQVELSFGAPGLLRRLELSASAELGPEGGPFRANLSLAELRPDALSPHLAALGMQHRLSDGELQLAVSGGWAPTADGGLGAHVALHDLSLSDDDRSLLGLERLGLEGVVFSASGDRLHVEAVQLQGLHASASLLSDGHLRLPGIEILPVAPAAASAAGVAPTRAAATPASAAPYLTVGRVQVTDNRLTWTGPGAPPLDFSDLDLALVGIDLPPGLLPALQSLELGLTVPGLVSRLAVTGGVSRNGEAVQAELTMAGEGLQSSGLSSLLASSGPVPELKDGKLKLALSARALMGPEGSLSAQLSVSDLSLEHDAEERLSWKRLSVDGFRSDASGTSVQQVGLSGLRVLAHRDSAGVLHLPGLRVPPAADGPAPASPSPALQAPAAALPNLSLGRLHLPDALVRWRDDAAKQPVDEQLGLSFELDAFALSAQPTPARFALDIVRAQGPWSTRIDGTLLPSPSSPRVNLTLTGEKLRFDFLRAYLPLGLEPSLVEGYLQAQASLALDPAPGGGHALQLSLSDMSLREGAEGPTVLGLASARIVAPRIDAEAQVFHLEALELTGVQGLVSRDAEGGVSLPGLRMLPVPSSGVVRTPAPATNTDYTRVPDLRVERVLVSVDSFVINEAGRDPLRLEGLRLATSDPVQLNERDEPMPFGVTLVAGLPPLLDRLELTARLSPFAVEPSLDVGLKLQGLRGPALAGLAPELSASLDASELQDGQLDLRLLATWMGRRRGPLHFDTAPGVPLDLTLRDLTLRDGAGGEVLVGLQSLRADVSRALGSDGRVVLRSLEIVKPVASVAKTARGLELAHLILLPPPAADPDAPPPAPVPEQHDFRSPAERTIERLLVSGVDVTYADRTTTPPMVMPLVGLDLEARDVSTLALTQSRKLAVDLLVRGGVVDEPWSSGLPVFEEIELEALVELFPRLTGRVRLRTAALDLTSVAGPAAQGGVTIHEGLLDSRVDLHFEPSGDLVVDTRSLFTDLDVDEPAGGPISSFLKLPSPLGTVLFVLRDEDGVIDVPLSFSVDSEGISVAEVSRIAVTTLGVLIGPAIANTPFRIVGGITGTVGSLIGFGGGEDELGEPVRVSFAPASTRPMANVAEQVAALAERLDDESDLRITLRHESGQADLDLLSVRANPAPEFAIDLATRMRLSKGRLELERSAESQRLQATLAAGLLDRAAGHTARLLSLDGEIGRLERALDALLDVLRPGSEGMAERRTRALSLAVARLRLDHLAGLLREHLDRDDWARVRVVAPRPGGDPSSVDGAVLATPSRIRGD